jgi:sulfonate transport system ATP-binding protein
MEARLQRDVNGQGPERPPVVHTSGVRRSFGSRVVLDGVDLDIAHDEFVAMLGRSGSGKTTFLRILSGLDTNASGEIRLPSMRANVFQEPRLMPWKRVLDNVVLGLRGPGAKEKGHKALQEVELATHEQAWPITLSGGEAQRTALARALVREPELLLLDEPFGALDALTRIRMHSLLEELCRVHRPTVLLVTHDVDEAILLADRVVVLTDGRISLDVRVDLDRPRLRGDPHFDQLRSVLLSELGVVEPGGPKRATPAALADQKYPR